MGDTMHFWHSLKMAEREAAMGEESNTVEISGRRVPYTICSDTLEHGALWDDLLYLGEAPAKSIRVHASKFRDEEGELYG